MMQWHLLLSIICYFVAFSTEDDFTKDENEDLVKEINSKAKCWKASLDSAKLLQTPEDFEMRLGAFPKEVSVGSSVGSNDYAPESEQPDDLQESVADLPRNFDSRERWPKCPSIGKVVDQGPCGGCWATAATAVAADRYCIQNVGQENPFFSYADLLTCSTAGSCGGGSSKYGYGYMKQEGIPSGAMQDDDGWEETCSPSPFELCNHHQKGTHEICPDSHTLKPPTCVRECREESGEDYETDRYYVDEYWDLWSAEEIMNEIYRRGPVSIAFKVYKDYYFYLDGVYEHVAGEDIGMHAVKLIGWGYDEDCDLDYWILSNSWDPDWGENGFIRVKKGDGHLGIGSLGAEACSMKLSAELEKNAKILLQMESLVNEASESLLYAKGLNEEDVENQVGFLAWNVIAPRNAWFALATLGVFASLHLLLSICFKIKTCFTSKQRERQTTYDAVPMNNNI